MSIRQIVLTGILALASTLSFAGETLYYYHNDHLGTPQAMTDENQTVVWQADYLPFGRAYGVSTALIENNLRFPGQYYDAESGLHYNYFRDYDPSMGRYIQSDPIGLGGGINTYGYVGGNPIRYTDPFGLFQFATRPLGNSALGFPIGNSNLGVQHEHGLFDWVGDIGYFQEGIRSDDPAQLSRLTRGGPFYDDGLMQQALENLINSGNWLPDDPNEPWYSNSNPNDYDLTLHNCQDFADALRDEYRRLGGGTGRVPCLNGVCGNGL